MMNDSDHHDVSLIVGYHILGTALGFFDGSPKRPTPLFWTTCFLYEFGSSFPLLNRVAPAVGSP